MIWTLLRTLISTLDTPRLLALENLALRQQIAILLRQMSSSSLVESVTDRFPDAVAASHAYRGDETVVLRRESLLEVARFLKEDPALQMNFPMDLSTVDYSAFGKSPAPGFLRFLWCRGEAPGPDPG